MTEDFKGGFSEKLPEDETYEKVQDSHAPGPVSNKTGAAEGSSEIPGASSAEEPVAGSAGGEKNAKHFEVDVSAAEDAIPDYVESGRVVYDFELEKGKKRKPRKRGAGCLSGAVYLVLVIALSIGLAIFALTVVNDVTGLVKDDVEITVEIPKGASLTDIAKILKDNGLIDNEIGLLAFAKLAGLDYTYHQGTFTLNPRMGYHELLKALAQQSVSLETVKVTIIEGWTIDEIAQKLESSQVCTALEFTTALENNDYSDYDFIAAIPENEDRIYKMEGYIFPDTYDFYKGSDADTVIRKFLDNFEVRFSQELRDEAEAQGMTVEEVVILASMVQEEGASEKTMQMVAGVFRNRLDNPSKYPYLQSNATLSYALGEPILWMDEDDLENPDPYNTYVHEGLPPSAICNPGLQAIKAVLYPDENDYYFFVTDENNLFYFSETASQHEKQVNSIRKNGVGIGEGVS